MSPRGIAVFAVSLLLGALAAGARAEEPKVYRWVGQDGRVYTSNSPPKGTATAIPAAPDSDRDSCGRFGERVASWRDAQKSVESWEATIDRLQSRTDNFIRRDDTAYNDSLDRANQHLEEARERASQIESESRAAGVPQSCLTE